GRSKTLLTPPTLRHASLQTRPLHLDQIVKSVSAVCENVKILERRTENVEQRISDTEDSATQLLARLEGAETRLNEALARLEDQENGSRRNNIKIITLPERTEGDKEPVRKIQRADIYRYMEPFRMYI
uniref:Uncharacterized protein n=1 Tax=Oryzias sinensis TaxID=183150 RepID=A0A8C7YC77_9TELE